jgi:hypothetical protein
MKKSPCTTIQQALVRCAKSAPNLEVTVGVYMAGTLPIDEGHMQNRPKNKLTKAHTEFAVTQTSVTPKCVTSSVYSCSSQTVRYGLPEVTSQCERQK